MRRRLLLGMVTAIAMTAGCVQGPTVTFEHEGGPQDDGHGHPTTVEAAPTAGTGMAISAAPLKQTQRD